MRAWTARIKHCMQSNFSRNQVAHEPEALMSDKIILLVEDNPDDQLLTQRALKKYHIPNRVVIATDGAEALDYLFREGIHSSRRIEDNPYVVLLDLKLPKIDGLQVLEKLRGDSRTQRLPVVVLTSSTQQSDIESAYRLGANSYLRKSVDSDEFYETVGHLGLYWLKLNINSPVPRMGVL